jgi:multidrug efflux pump subunit AcrA (membrane-fusion protein)
VPLPKLKRLGSPRGDERGAPVTVRDRAAWAAGRSRTGEVRGLIGAIDGQTRMARVLVSVPDPLARRTEGDTPILIVGAIVQADIEGKPLEGVVKIHRDHLRQDDTVWVMRDGALDVRKVTVAFRDAGHAYISDGLEEGEMIVTSSLATVADGAPLRTEGTAPAAASVGSSGRR